MSDGPPASNSSSSSTTKRAEDYVRFKHLAALTFVFAAPVLIALPPRKLDLYTVSLGTAFIFSANHLTVERTGRSITEHIGSRISRTPPIMRNLPSEKAEALQAQLRAAREAQIRDGAVAGEELEKLKRRQRQEAGVAERIWMGGETEGWKERRLKEEQKALDEGKGYGDLIKEHIWEVWNWGRKGSREGEGEGEDLNGSNK